MDINQMLFVGTIVVLIAVVLVQAVTNWKQGTRHADQVNRLVDSLSVTLQQISNNPVWVENAKAVGVSVPQAVFGTVVARLDAFEGLVGQQSQIGKLAQQVEDLVKRIDKDPSNDPRSEVARTGDSRILYSDGTQGTYASSGTSGQVPPAGQAGELPNGLPADDTALAGQTSPNPSASSQP